MSTRSIASGRAQRVAKILLGLSLAVGFSFLFLRGADLPKLGGALLSADPWLFGAAVIIAMVGFWARAARWCCYLLPAKQVSTRRSFDIMMLGYMTSNFIPGRVGDFVVRPALMRRDEGIRITTSLASIAIERLFDLVTVLAFFATYVALFAPASLGGLDLAQLRLIGAGMLAGCVVVIAILVLMRRHQARAMRLIDDLLSPLPAGLRERIGQHAKSFAEGLNLFHDARGAALTIGYSLIAWGTVAIAMWLVARSLGIAAVRLVDSLLLVALGTVGVAIPTPGGVGSFQFFIEKGLKALGGGPREAVLAAAILIWAMTWVPINLLGLLLLTRRGVGLAQLEAEVTPETGA